MRFTNQFCWGKKLIFLAPTNSATPTQQPHSNLDSLQSLYFLTPLSSCRQVHITLASTHSFRRQLIESTWIFLEGHTTFRIWVLHTNGSSSHIAQSARRSWGLLHKAMPETHSAPSVTGHEVSKR